MKWKLSRLLCIIGKHDLTYIRKLSEQAALYQCEDCGRKWAIKMSGDCEGAGIPWEEAESFYASFPRLEESA